MYIFEKFQYAANNEGNPLKRFVRLMSLAAKKQNKHYIIVDLCFTTARK